MNLKLKHKRLYALLVVLCLVLSLAVLLTACKKNTDDGNDDNGDNSQTTPPAYTGGPEDGAYYYDVADGELSLVLTGGTFTIKGPGYDKSGTYTRDENTMALVFTNTEDGTATATIAGNTIALSHKNATMTFLKKVPFTVTFNVDGGSAVAPLTVVNGKTAAKPTDPTKAEYAFLGWYTDSSLKTAYSFTTPVTSDITVYAKWIKLDDGPVYNVGFDLGYAGAPILEDVTTINGEVYNLPETPTRDGYTFEGWWISAFEDGAKLTYEYTEGTKLTADTTLYALWSADDAALAAPDVNVGASGLIWNAVPGANTYRVIVKDSAGEVIASATTATRNYTFNFANYDAGMYSFEVVAVGTGKISDAAVRYYNNKALGRVSGLKIVDGKLIFNSVANAEKYIITVDCGNKEHNHDAFDNGLSTYFDFSNCSMQVGGIKFSVVAAAEGYANSIPSEVCVYEKNLAPIGSVSYDKATDSFVWDAVENATAYNVVITVNGATYTFKVTATSISLASYTGTINATIAPIADGYNSPAATNATATKTAPAKVQNLVLNNTTLSWTGNADSYVIEVNGKQYTTTATTYALNVSELGLTAGTEYTVSVKAVIGTEESEAATVTMISGQMGTALNYADKVVSWPAVIGCTNFKVKVNDGEEIVVTGNNFVKVTLTKAGENVIEVICSDITDDWTNAAKITVTAYAVKYVTRTADGGESVEYLANGDTLTPPTGMTANGRTFGGWYNTPLAAEDNGKEYTESKFFGNADLTLYANWTPNKYNITLDVDTSYITNIANGSTEEVTYTKNYKLPVPVSTDESRGFFVGWFTALNGGGIKMTDDLGYSVEPYAIANDVTLYPYFAKVLSYIDVVDENNDVVGYYVTKGLGITNRNVTMINVPAFYNEKPVIGIADNAFHSCSNIVSFEIPDSIEYVGQGAFELCTRLEAINMYDADPDVESDTPYSTHDGALLYYHATSDATYLEVFPSAKGGEYTVPDEVDIIGPGAFRSAKIAKVIISKGVSVVSQNAFINCLKLTEIEFEFGREYNVTIEDGAFADTPNVETLILPAKVVEFENIKMFDVFEDLSTIEIEGGNPYYSSKDNLICDSFGTKLLYVPKSFRGVFEVPFGIIEIGDKLFYGNPHITKVIIGEHVATIGADAFNGCDSLAEIIIRTPREEIFTIGNRAFANCNYLRSVTIEGSTITNANENLPIYINDGAFQNCAKLESFTVGDNAHIREIASYAFAGCSSLESFIVAPSAKLNIIGDYVFNDCTGLTKFEIHGTTTSVGIGAFEGCSRLNTVSLGEGTSELSLGADVFKDCIRLATVELPSTLVSFNTSLFDGCEFLQNIIVDEDNPFLASIDGVLYTKDGSELIYYPRTRDITNGILDFTASEYANLKKIGPSVFKNNPKVKAIKFGAGIEEIANSAFENCINLTSVEFDGENAKFALGAYAFANCSQLTAISLPSSTTRIGSYAFDHSALASFTLPAATTEIGYRAFSYTDLTTFKVTANVIHIGQGAFLNAKKLSSVTFDARTSDLQIGYYNDNEAKEEGVEFNVNEGVFMGTALTSIDIPKETVYIGRCAFNGLTSLATVNIPSDAYLVQIDEYAFAKTAISSITLNEGLTTISAYAFEGTKLASVTIPASVQYIYGYAFSIPTLTSVSFVEGSNEGIGLNIKNYAFAGADLTSMHLPAQLKSFGEAAGKYAKYGFTAIHVFYDVLPDKSSFTPFSGNARLATITVSADNTKYCAVDGVLYAMRVGSNTPYRLLFSPTMNLGNNGTVTVPGSVELVDYTAFLQTRLTQIIFAEHGENDTNGLQLGYLDATRVDPVCPPVFSNYVDKYENYYRAYTNLELVQFPAHLHTFMNYVFDSYNKGGDNDTPAKLTLKFSPESLVSFKAFAMRTSSAIKYIELPKLAYIGEQSFYSLGQLTGLKFTPGSTLTSIGYRSFEQCAELKNFELPATVKTIEKMAFQYCSSLDNFTVEEGSQLEIIMDQAFWGLGSHRDNKGYYDSEITLFTIPDTVKTVGKDVFRQARIKEIKLSVNLIPSGTLLNGCETIEKIHVPEDHPTLSSVDGIVYDKAQTAIYLIPSNWAPDSYEIPDTVTTIDDGTFKGFKGTYVKLPASLISIGSAAFENAKITRVEIPAGVQSIGSRAFYNCTDLVTITIPTDSILKEIGVSAFHYTAIQSIYLPETVDFIGGQAFESCRKLKTIEIPSKVTALEQGTFRRCVSLETITLNHGLERIYGNVFAYCGALKGIDLPDSVTHIEQYAFNECTSMTEFICSDSSQLRSVGNAAFYKCSALEVVSFGPALSGFVSNGTTGKYLTFFGCNALKEVVLPAAMTSIPDTLFSNLTNLEKVTLPADLEEIGIESFMGCPKITTITIPKGVKFIGDAAFANCTALTEVIFEDGVQLTYIPANAFANCASLASINIPASVESIDNAAFANTGFTTIALPAALKEIGNNAFYGCAKLTAISIPASVTSIGSNAFANCSELAELNLASGLKAIGTFAFAECVKLTAVTLPDTLATLTSNPFLGCMNLVLTLDANNTNFVYSNGVLYDATGYTLVYYSPVNTEATFTLPDTVFEIAGGAFGNSQLETIVLNEHIKAIPTSAFRDSASLKNIVIPGTVSSIGDAAFMGCSALEAITIPASVTSIGNYAFADCVNLATFTLADRKDNITVGDYLFYGCAKITKTYEFPGVTDFTRYMYAGTGITSIVFADNTNFNIEGVFAGSALENVTFGALATERETLGKAFFAGSNLASIVIPDKFAIIGESAFANCAKLVSVTLSADSIGASAFENCAKLTTLVVVKPATSDPKAGHNVSVGARAFANDTALSNTNIFEFAYQYGEESFLNCSAVSGEITLNSMVNSIHNYAFSGMTVSKIIIGGRDYYLYDYSLAGLTENTTILFSSATSLEAVIERFGGQTAWAENTSAKFEFFVPDTGEVKVTLTDEELKWLETMIAEGQIDKAKGDLFKERWLEYKKNYVTLIPSEKLTEEEVRSIKTLIEEFKLGEKIAAELEKTWPEYNKTLSAALTSHPRYFTEAELTSFNELAGKMDEATQNAFKQAWFEYKVSYSDLNPSDLLTREEEDAVLKFCMELGLGEDFAFELMNRWPAYRKDLAASLVEPVYINLTQKETDTLSKFCERNGLKDAFEDLQRGWMAYKGALTITSKEDAAELTADELALIETMIATYSLEPKMAAEYQGLLLAIKQSYATTILAKGLIDEMDTLIITEFINGCGLDESIRADVEKDILAYKKFFFLSEYVPEGDLTAEETEQCIAFLTKYNVDSKLHEKQLSMFRDYRKMLSRM